MGFKQRVKPFVPKGLISFRRDLLSLKALRDATRPLHERKCPICGYHGYFGHFGKPPRLDAACKNCGSLERHRLFWLWFDGDKSKLSEPILHFAPERILKRRFKEMYENYKTADLFATNVDLKLNIEDMGLGTGSLSTLICNHVLEHVNDRKALREIFRVLCDKGKLICSVPIIEGWERTYENDSATSAFERELHFGQSDHVRYYGRDFRDRLLEAGFVSVREITADGQNVSDYGLLRGEKFFICSKE